MTCLTYSKGSLRSSWLRKQVPSTIIRPRFTWSKLETMKTNLNAFVEHHGETGRTPRSPLGNSAVAFRHSEFCQADAGRLNIDRDPIFLVEPHNGHALEESNYIHIIHRIQNAQRGARARIRSKARHWETRAGCLHAEFAAGVPWRLFGRRPVEARSGWRVGQLGFAGEAATRACLQLRRMAAQARWTAARKILASLS